ncbi:calcium-binding protein [Mesorhizobium sp. YC-39]|uniref:calcium-binding protein n=1 Tax=unclassified Mesorhizobium TaxID=325217 RepID=UPI0021E973A7|nr:MULTISPECIES: calcium-binding protein [unclassified Mesorhizobium]MCV3208014.1 calcium-binding protein [Mesorhizobium sp. YC-2]MCV3229741.1 calcium-binding protein [Mesorhizobium sp. YC-39]
MATMHYTWGASAAQAQAYGFNLVDLQYASSVNALPAGSKALIWLGESNGVTQSFIDKVTPLLNNPKVFGFFLTDEPDPTGRYHTQVSAATLKAESDWIHSHFPGAKTFITLMDMGPYTASNYSNTYNPANTGIDYYGINPYPVRTTAVDFNYIDRAVAAALAAGIPQSAIVPVYQTFGGGGWATNTGGSYVMPTTSQMQTMMDHWERLVPNPAFDMAYKWSSQNGETSLGNTPSMQAFFREHNTTTTTPPPTTPPPTTPPPTTDTIYGTSGANVLRAAGAHTMIGYGGNDDYYVDHAGDKVIESAGQGQDRVWTAVSYALSAGSSIEVLGTTNDAGTTAINLTGNALAQTIQGNAGANVFNGQGGADKMVGLGGNDGYYVDNAGDRVVEAAGGGRDNIVTTVSYALAAGSEIEVLATRYSATTAINLTGNEFAQTIQGNAGANVINGGGGADTMVGYGGNDGYYVDNAGDKVVEAAGGGRDNIVTTVSYALAAGSEIEVLATRYSATTAINLTGNEFAQTIQGNAGANVINGGRSADILTGNGGNDTFVFNSALGNGNVDRITDFNPSQDKIHLENAIFAGLSAGALTSAAFFAGAAAHDSSDHIIYNSSTGALSFDSDGIGGAAQIQFATLSPGLSLAAASFFVT